MSGDIVTSYGASRYQSTRAGIVASTTQDQDEELLDSEYNEVATVANDNDVVTLPEAVAGRSCTIVNNGANILQIFPTVDDAIDDGAVDASTTLAPGGTVTFKSYNLITWETVALIVGLYTRKETIVASAAIVGPTAPTEVTVGTFIGWAFDADAETVDILWRVPTDWDGADVVLAPHWV